MAQKSGILRYRLETYALRNYFVCVRRVALRWSRISAALARAAPQSMQRIGTTLVAGARRATKGLQLPVPLARIIGACFFEREGRE